ncbi:MAG: DUF2085 domain-containing protein [Pyrinomonadaceae bacterium]
MATEIENYNPQAVLKANRKRAYKIWAGSGLAVVGWMFLILLAPIARSNGWTGLSEPLYKFFRFLCHQMPERSFYLVGNQLAVCSRCFGVYFGLVFGFLIYPLIRSIDEIEPLPRVWLFLSVVPIGVDWSLGVLGIWDNTHLSRFVTGLILGSMCAIFIIPALVELGQLISNKRNKKGLPV